MTPIASKRAALWLIPLVALTFANVYGNAFLFDDEFLILRNRFLDAFSNLGAIFTSSSTAGAGFGDSFYRPMQGLAYLIVTQIFGRAPAAFHALNVGLHVANALLVYRLARVVTLGPRAALWAAALWAVHPLHVEAVTYISATADPLHAFFVLAALNVAAPSFGPARLAGASLLALLGMLSKESAIVAPALLCAVVFAVDPRRWSWRAYVKTLPLWMTAAGYYLVRHALLHFDDRTAFFKTANAYADDGVARLATALAALPAYLELLIWPHDLHMDRDFPVYTDFTAWPVLGGLALVMAGLALVYRAYRARTRPAILAAAAVAWIAAAHLPHSGVLIAVNSVFLEHWIYLTALPLFLAAGALAGRGFTRAGLGVLVVAALAQKTFRQNRVWATPVAFFSHTLRYSPKSARIRHNLAIAYSEAGDDARALEQYELMIRAGTTYPQTFHNAGLIHLKQGDGRRGEAYLLRALELDPKFYPSAQYLAEYYARTGDAARSARYLDLYQRLAP